MIAQQNQIIELQNYPAEIPEGRIARFLGIYIYSYLPPVMRPALVADLFHGADRPKSQLAPKRGVRYIIESFRVPGHYHAHKMIEETTFEELKPWFSEGKIWVKKEA